MTPYIELYHKKFSRAGSSPTDRLEKGRERNFEKFKEQSPHYVTYTYQDKKYDGVLEPREQDETKTMVDLLCAVDVIMDIGSILFIAEQYYMVWFFDERQKSGYNRYCLLKMTEYVTWINNDNLEEIYSSYAYCFDQENNMLKNEIKSRSRSATLYMENLKLAFMILPFNKNINIESYLTINYEGKERSFRITGYDFLSTKGVMYVSMDPTLKRDLSPAPEYTPDKNKDDFFWAGEIEV